MIKQIETFLLVLSLVYLLRFAIEFLLKLRDENPKPIEIAKVNQVFIYLAISYVITFIIL
jgi:hypothetical protein